MKIKILALLALASIVLAVLAEADLYGDAILHRGREF